MSAAGRVEVRRWAAAWYRERAEAWASCRDYVALDARLRTAARLLRRVCPPAAEAVEAAEGVRWSDGRATRVFSGEV